MQIFNTPPVGVLTFLLAFVNDFCNRNIRQHKPLLHKHFYENPFVSRAPLHPNPSFRIGFSRASPFLLPRMGGGKRAPPPRVGSHLHNSECASMQSQRQVVAFVKHRDVSHATGQVDLLDASKCISQASCAAWDLSANRGIGVCCDEVRNPKHT